MAVHTNGGRFEVDMGFGQISQLYIIVHCGTVRKFKGGIVHD